VRTLAVARVVAACLMLLIAISAAADALRKVTSDVEREGSRLHVTANIVAAAPLATCWATAVDFDHVADFIPHMTSSRVVSGPGEPLLVRQIGKASAGLFSTPIDVTMHMVLEPEHHIGFRSVAGNVKHMQGHWTFDGDAAHCSIEYVARIEPAFWVPPLLGPLFLRAQVEEQLRGLVTEIERRAAPVYRDTPESKVSPQEGVRP
jgi:ribosome-associated toxin RatA of RatAB toxin-antitoxin module